MPQVAADGYGPGVPAGTLPADQFAMICTINSGISLAIWPRFLLAKTQLGAIAGIVPQVAKSPILPLAAAVAAVAIGASPALAAPLSAGKHDAATVVAFPLYAAKGQNPAGFGDHVSHSSHDSHVSGGGGHSSHSSHDSHVSGGGYHSSHSSHDSHSSSVPAPVVSTTLPAVPVSSRPTTPAPASSQSLGSPAGLSSAVAPSQSGLVGSPLVSGSPVASSSGHGCAFVIVAPFSAAASGIRRLTRRRRPR
jgi:hypothetical protein